MRSGRPLVLAALILILSVSAAFARDSIVIAGSGDSQQLLRVLAEAFQNSHPGARVQVPDSIGSSGGIKAAASGDCDLGRVARPLREREKPLDLNYLPFARSPVVFAANLDAPCVNNLTEAQVNDIYAGRIGQWSELGACPQHKIYVANREEGDSSRAVLEQQVAGFQEVAGSAGKVIYSTPETVEVLSRYRFTLAYLPLSTIRGNTALRVFNYRGVAPEPEAVRSGDYPLVTPFGLVWQGRLEGPARQFVEFLFSSEAQQIMERQGVVPLPQPGHLPGDDKSS
ncbi:hypothetical protein DESUT3_30230 [Desulfuromonas versatilis]|uniref:PBP domain-containing protein n=1 Tax=Desulfuromonas versatilis TaxID=2802975 RepID=A0ABM8HYT1_9BACT|nr:substrate-binding domain-containing protein [Desulfuromonas versatilis]BCR05954.1 hypothetical protein DESUT3_30230 [Desulfuromonas versatilis]